MCTDPIIEELHQIRAEHAASFNYDLAAIVEDLRAKQQQSERMTVSFPPRLVRGERRKDLDEPLMSR